ncbi:hypothetical protein PINS_up003839 [Pythium insidiosum]|nr:hypothetical protein PINS_up003839 [Pythium insidiosum]
MKRSRQVTEKAKLQKHRYDAIAKEYESRGYSPSPNDGDDEPSRDDDDEIDADDADADADAAKVGGDADLIGKTTIVHPPSRADCDKPRDHSVTAVRAPRSASSVFLEDVLSAPVDLAATHHDLGVVLLAKKDFDQAVKVLRQAVALAPSNSQAWYHLAKALDGNGEPAEAEDAIQKSLAIVPDSLPGLSLLGKLLNARGEHEEAIDVFRRALRLQS